MDRPGWNDPKRQILLVVLLCLGLYIYYTLKLGGFKFFDFFEAIFAFMFFQFDSVPDNVAALAIDVVVFGVGGVIAWLAFFGQFVLPVKTLKERREVVSRLLSTLGVSPGPAIFVQDGQIIDHADEEHRRGAGVILLDTASAVVLHNQAQFTRAEGPGLVFTNRGEGIAAALDLHVQVRRIGPLDDDKDPDAPEVENMDTDIAAGWRERRLQTSGLTRDGVEVIPNITAVFRLRINESEDRKTTRFGYNADSVWRAIAYRPIDPNAPGDAQSRVVEWDWLPIQMAADLWREHLRKYRFNELFDLAEDEAEREIGTSGRKLRTNLEVIVAQINNRMKKDLIEEFDDFGKRTGRRRASREWRILRERGLDVINISVGNLRFDPDIEARFVTRWSNSWLQRAREQQRFVERLQAFQRSRGQSTANEEFIRSAGRRLYRRVVPRAEATFRDPTETETLELLVDGMLDSLHTQPELKPQLTDVESELNELKEWLRQRRHGA